MSGKDPAPRRHDSRRCTTDGCNAWAMRGSDRCRSHQPLPPNPGGGEPPDRTRHGGYAELPPQPTLDDLIASLVARVNDLNRYLAQHDESVDVQAYAVAADMKAKIARLLREKQRTSGEDADTIAALLSKAVGLLFDNGQD